MSAVLGWLAMLTGSEQSPKMLTTPEIRVRSEQRYGSSAKERERDPDRALFSDIKGSTELMEDLDPEKGACHRRSRAKAYDK